VKRIVCIGSGYHFVSEVLQHRRRTNEKEHIIINYEDYTRH
jgi:hypothetical protein